MAWTIEKAKYIKREAAEVEQELGPGCQEHLVKKFADSKKTIERNTKRMELLIILSSNSKKISQVLDINYSKQTTKQSMAKQRSKLIPLNKIWKVRYLN